MGKLFWIGVLILFLIGTSHRDSFSKTTGNFKAYHQITDKEVVVASTKGAHILFRAVQPNTISILVFEEGDTFALLSPSQALNDSPLNGSIYVEELEDLMQITSASDDGLIIEIAKYPLGFLFRNKQTFATGTATSNTVFIEKGDFLSLLIASPGKGVEIVNRTNEGDKNSISANVPGSGTSTSDRSILDLIK